MLRLLILLLALLSACAKPPEPVWTKLPSAESLLWQLSNQSGQIRSLDVAAKVGLTLEGKYRSTQQFILVESPDRLRLDVLTGFGQLVLQLTSDGQQLAVFLNTTVPGRFFRGAASDENLSRFTRLPLSARNIVRLLLYDPPVIAHQQAQVQAVEGGLLLSLHAKTQRQELRFDQQLQLIGCRYFTDQQLFLDVAYSEIDSGDQFPRRTQIELPIEQVKLTIQTSELETNARIAAERFQLQTPASIPVEAIP